MGHPTVSCEAAGLPVALVQAAAGAGLAVGVLAWPNRTSNSIRGETVEARQSTGDWPSSPPELAS